MTDLQDRLLKLGEDICASELGGDEYPRNLRLVADAADRIDKLEALLRRIDAVIIWETTPLGRSFQDEIEAALKRQ